MIRVSSLKKLSVWNNHTHSELLTLPTWCCDNLSDQDYKIQNRYQRKGKHDCVYHQLVYVRDAQAKDQLLSNFGHSVLNVSQPLDPAHALSLEIRNVAEIRDNLLFKKFRYAVYFKYNRTPDLFNWLTDYFKDSTTTKVGSNRNWVRLYLEHDEELTMIKLTWSDKIDYVKSIRLVSDPSPLESST